MSFLRETLRRLEAEQSLPLRAVVIDETSTNHLDSSADSALHEIHAEYLQRNLGLYIAGAEGPVLDVMCRSGLNDTMDANHVFFEVADALDAVERDHLKALRSAGD